MLKLAEFYNNLQYANIGNWDRLILYAQAYCESNLSNELTMKAYNPFSVKATKSWKGDVYLLKNNPEVVNGKEVIIADTFRKYPNFSIAIINYVRLIERLYPESYEHRNEYKLYYYWLINGKRRYATCTNYTERLVAKYEELNINDFKEALNSVGEKKLWATS